ncbi:metal-dependent hydrolase [Natrinema pallidum]|uniref:Membrane-bound metal-dependent hydrolase n=2 Tax=Natrinema pallidum TaxID=69527 RepID=L9Z8Y4_9EURY|nr:metal-dependent hydrolase [Natrinema pallidum]ELY82092.1 membrane-bound metal-dependent hydrolase [Natrinema pallidum DSM 3751]QCW03493.1 metal-dependent hydrolase [Natrinema pallidum]
MWPWEHAIVAYLSYSLLCHVAVRDSPGGLDAFAVVVASVLPDLIDKPLAWTYGVFDVGYGLGHSIFFAVPVAIVAGTVARAADRPLVGLAFGLGYLSHPFADIMDAFFRQDTFLIEITLWPIAPAEGRPPGSDVLDVFVTLAGRYANTVLAGDLSTYLWIQLGLAALTALVWLLDGAPVLRECLRATGRAIATLLGRDTPSSRTDPEQR